MAPSGASKSEDKGVGEVVSDLWQLVRDYAKQETIGPLKGVGRFLMFGIPGALAIAVGFVFVTLGVMRGLQTQTGAHLTGSFTWVPYLVALAVDVIVIVLAGVAISKPFRGEEKRA